MSANEDDDLMPSLAPRARPIARGSSLPAVRAVQCASLATVALYPPAIVTLALLHKVLLALGLGAFVFWPFQILAIVLGTATLGGIFAYLTSTSLLFIQSFLAEYREPTPLALSRDTTPLTDPPISRLIRRLANPFLLAGLAILAAGGAMPKVLAWTLFGCGVAMHGAARLLVHHTAALRGARSARALPDLDAESRSLGKLPEW